MPALELHEITVRYSVCDAPALQIPHLRVSQGETVAITGPSGSGKTTLISILCGLEPPATGTVRWDDTHLNRLPETQKDRWRAHHIGLVMQDFHLHPGLSAKENVLLPAHFQYWRVPGALRQRADELLERVGMRTGSRPVGKFSRGEMQRVAVARAMLMSPPVLVADEPTASLDTKNGENVTRLLLDLAREQSITLLAVTHDRRLVQGAARRLMLENGQLVQDQATEVHAS